MGRVIILGLIAIALWYYSSRPADPATGEKKSLASTFTGYVAPKIAPQSPLAAPAPTATLPGIVQASPALQPAVPSAPAIPGQPVAQEFPKMVVGGVVTSGPPIPKNATLGEASFEVPQVSDHYVMNYRPVPAADFLQSWERMGVTAVADPVSRVISFRGLAGPCEGFKAALAAMDQLPGGCSVQAWTVYVDRRVEKGWDLVAALGAVTGLTDTRLTIGPSGLALDVSADKIKAALDVIADGGSVEVVQNPYVRLLNGEPAKVESTQEVPTAETVVSNGVSQGSVRYRKVGLQLEVTPTFYASDRVRLGIVQTNGVVGASVLVGGNQVPVIQSQTVSSVADMTVGQTLVLGGVRTTRNVVKKGILGSSTEVTEGALYVILSTYTDEPRAVPVEDPEQPFPAGIWEVAPPLTETAPDGSSWTMGELLPPIGWESQEKAFLQQRAGSSK